MSNAVKSIRVDPETASDIERLSTVNRTTFSALAAEMLCEAAKARRRPGGIPVRQRFRPRTLRMNQAEGGSSALNTDFREGLSL